MPYIRVWIHLIWSTKNRQPILKEDIRKKLFTHIQKNARQKDIYLNIINGYLDHVHVLISLTAEQYVARIAQLLKGESSRWVNKNKLTPVKFEWQEEYIAVSVSESMVGRVREYIKGQEEHHRKSSFVEEYREFIEKYSFPVSDTDGG